MVWHRMAMNSLPGLERGSRAATIPKSGPIGCVNSDNIPIGCGLARVSFAIALAGIEYGSSLW